MVRTMPRVLATAALGALSACGAASAAGAPSAAARMPCAAESQAEIAAQLGEHVTALVSPSWRNQVYSCRYVYAQGTMTLSVKELTSSAAAAAYSRSLAASLGHRDDPLALGDESFVTQQGSVVVRKGVDVLLVDVGGLPATFGLPPIRRVDVAEVVAESILHCWTGG